MKKSLILFFLIPFITFGQNELCNKVFNANECTFYGVDFSHVKFMNVNAYGFSDLNKITSFYIGQINDFLFSEYDLSDWTPNYFSKLHTFKNAVIVKQRNATIDVSDIMVTNENNIEPSIDSILSYYKNENMPENLGVVLMAETLVKANGEEGDVSYGTFWVVFFDIQTGKKLVAEKMTGNAQGIGWDRFWITSVKNVLRDINMKKLSKKYCP